MHMEFLETLSLSQVFQDVCFSRNLDILDSMCIHGASLPLES